MGPLPPRRRATVLLYPGCTIAEIIELTTRLAGAEVDVHHVAVDHEPIVDQSGLLLSPDRSIDDLEADAPTIDPTTAEVVIVPGGDPGSVVEDERVLGYLRSAAERGSVLAGICAGVLLLGAAGVLAGRSITHNYRRPWAPPEVEGFVANYWAGARVEPDPTVGVVVDGPVITALPNATIDFTTTVGHRLGLYSAEQAELLTRHLRGDFVEELHQQP